MSASESQALPVTHKNKALRSPLVDRSQIGCHLSANLKTVSQPHCQQAHFPRVIPLSLSAHKFLRDERQPLWVH